MTKEDIMDRMIDSMPYKLDKKLLPYIYEAMDLYAYSEAKELNIHDVSKSDFCECPEEEQTPIKYICTKCNKEWKI